tara:strand:+ start:832 stop:1542 length:711 start_codon:yes stop_codon:yes gene_type:complete
MVTKNIAIILARGGSKRLPTKNILKLQRKPLVAWSIEAAINSGIFHRVLVSTDNKEIQNISKKYNADVPFLRKKAADDFSSSSIATFHALRQAEDYWGEKYNVVAQLMANCPLRTAEDIKKLYSYFKKNKSPSQISCFRFGWMNPWWASTINDKGKPTRIFSRFKKKRSQDLPTLYCPSGALWLAKRNNFLRYKNFYMPGYRLKEINWISALDIDDKDDFLMAKICLRIRNFKKRN